MVVMELPSYVATRVSIRESHLGFSTPSPPGLSLKLRVDIPMEIIVEKMGDVAVVVVLDSELNSNNAPEFKRVVVPVLETNTKLVIDLSRLRFIDSSGIGVLLFCLQQMTAKKGNLKLCGLSKRVREVVELVRMDRIVDIAESKEEAVHAFCQLPG